MGQTSNSGYKDLRVWRSSIQLAKTVYALTKHFPKDQLYSLASQLQRSAVSIASNIAEGCARTSHKEFLHFLGIASGSLAELTTQVTIAYEIGFIPEKDFRSAEAECDSIGKMLGALKSSIRAMKPDLPHLITNNQ